MKFFRNIILMLALAFCAMPAFAQNANPCDDIPETTRGKSPDAVATILSMCRSAAAGPLLNTVTANAPKPEEVSEWSQAAKGIAEAIGVAAKGLGIAVNEFLNSPAGVLVAFVLTVKYAGGVIIGIPFVVFSILVWVYVYRRASIKTIAYENVPMFWGMLTVRRKTKVEMEAMDGDVGSILFGTGFALMFLDLIVCLNV